MCVLVTTMNSDLIVTGPTQNTVTVIFLLIRLQSLANYFRFASPPGREFRRAGKSGATSGVLPAQTTERLDPPT